jgi:membrane glycosyltransferase
MTGSREKDRRSLRTTARRFCLAVAAMALAVVVWTAAHDILRSEADLTAEWTLIVFAGLLCVCSLMGWVMRTSAPPGRGRRG